jgi:hypothetical protein
MPRIRSLCEADILFCGLEYVGGYDKKNENRGFHQHA